MMKPLNERKHWMGVDFDGCLATDYKGRTEMPDGYYVLGAPVPPMIERVKLWLSKGIDVRIFTSRVAPSDDGRDVEKVRSLIQDWCELYVGERLKVTCIKEHGLIQLWDDRAVSVQFNTGEPWLPVES